MTLNELRQALGVATDELQKLVDDPKAFDAKLADIEELKGRILRAERAQAQLASLARPAGTQEPGQAVVEPGTEQLHILSLLDTVAPREVRRTWHPTDYLPHVRKVLGRPVAVDPSTQFRTMGEQLAAVARYYTSGRDVGAMDKRLVRAPTGASEAADPTSGGFLVQTDFATAVFARAYDMGELLGRVNKLSISTQANGIKIPAVDETSRATGSRWGGVQSYWVGEGTQPTATKPKFRLVELDLKKLMSLFYVTDELLADTTVLNSLASQAFSEEVMFMTEDSIFRGSGSGQPMGFLNAPAVVSVAKETGQASKTVVYENVLKMWSRMWSRSRANAVWFINQDVEPQLFSMSQVIGTAGVPVYLPANGISGQPYGTLFGRPVIPVEYADTVGNNGDITLVDLSQYVLADKGGIQAASSMHVAFLTDEMVFRITYRVDGEPIWHSPLTPYKGSNTLSPFITLAAR